MDYMNVRDYAAVKLAQISSDSRWYYCCCCVCVRVCTTCLRVHSNGTCTVFGFARNQPSVILHALPIHLRFVYTKHNFHRSVFAESESYCFAHFQCNIANRWNEEAAAVIARYERPLQVVFSAFRLVYWFTWYGSVHANAQAIHNNNFNTFINLYGKWFIECAREPKLSFTHVPGRLQVAECRASASARLQWWFVRYNLRFISFA